MPSTPSRSAARALRSNLRAMCADGAAYMAMLAFGETWFPAFSLALGHGAVRAGLVATLPLLFGALLQLAAPLWFARARSAKRWVTLCTGAQAAILALLAVATALDRVSIAGLWSLAALYHGCGLAAHPAWVGWAEQLVPPRIRARYFALRQCGIQVVLFGAVLGAGALLDAFGARSSVASGVLWPFACVFALASLSRFASTLCLRAQSEPCAPVAPLGWHARETLARWSHGRRARWWVALFSMQLALQVALPFTHPWMLDVQRLPYARYMVLLAIACAAKALAAWPTGSWARARGSESALRAAAFALVPSGVAWVVLACVDAPSFGALAFAQALTGAGQGAWEFAFFLLFFEGLRADERPVLLAVYGLGNALALALGSLLGGEWLRASARSSDGAWLGERAWLHDAVGDATPAWWTADGGWTALFACSAALRLVPLLFLLGVARESSPDSRSARTL